MPRVAASTTPRRTRRTKAQIEQEFLPLQEEVEQRQEEADPKADAFRVQKEAEVRQAVEGVTVAEVASRLSGLGVEISKALAGLSQQLIGEVSLLNSLKEAVALERRELEELHKVDLAATALDQLVQDHRTRKEQFEAEMAKQRSEWETEQQVREQDAKAYEDALKKSRQREAEDFEYKKSLERKKAQDRYEEELRLQERKNGEKQEALEKSWQQREQALKEREEELARLQKEAAEFPKRLEKETERARSEAIKSTQESFKHQMALIDKEREAEQSIAELRIKTLEETAARQTAHGEALERQLDEAKKQVQEIAVRAIEGASGANALSHVNQIAMEQAKQRMAKP
jgi:hypothetical protein